MQIDWITVAAQIVNFLILVWLLQRFLYKPITDAMRRREERIEDRLTDAKQAREEAEREARTYRQKQEDLEERKGELLKEARAEADELRARLETEIREEMEGKRAAWQDHLQDERDTFVATLQRQAGQRVIEITERVLADYADTDTAERVVASFAERLKALDEDARDKMTEAASEQDGRALVQTGTKLGSAAKGRITRAIHDTLSADIDVDYREDPDLVFGLRLTIGDATVEWSAMRYLKRLATELGEIVDAGSGTTGERQDREHGDEQDGKSDTDRSTQTEDQTTP